MADIAKLKEWLRDKDHIQVTVRKTEYKDRDQTVAIKLRPHKNAKQCFPDPFS